MSEIVPNNQLSNPNSDDSNHSPSGSLGNPPPDTQKPIPITPANNLISTLSYWLEILIKDPALVPSLFRLFSQFILLSLMFVGASQTELKRIFFDGDKISFEATKGGAVTVQENGKRTIIMTLSPNGGEKDEWVNPEIPVKEGDKITIHASGKINLSLPKLMEASEKDARPKYPWSEPDGLTDDHINADYPAAKEYKTMQDKPFGMLIATIQGQNSKLAPLAIGKNGQFEAQTDGNLLLTVNDIWLNPNKENAYLPPLPNNENEQSFRYYKNKVISSQFNNLEVAREKTRSWTPAKWNEEVRKEYEKRKVKWEQITDSKNYSLWYDDNVGSFSVTITIEPQKSSSNGDK